MNDLIGHLDAIGKETTMHIDSINSGGCCVFAALVAKHLSKYVPVQIRVASSWSESLVALGVVRKKVPDPYNIHHWTDNGVGFSHVFIEFRHKGKSYIYDSNGVQEKTEPCDPTFGYPTFPGSLTLAEATKFAMNKNSGWNKMFNRRQIKKLEKIVDKGFKALKQNKAPEPPPSKHWWQC